MIFKEREAVASLYQYRYVVLIYFKVLYAIFRALIWQQTLICNAKIERSKTENVMLTLRVL